MPWAAAHRHHFCTPLISEVSKLEILSLLITAVSGVLSCHLLFNTFLRQIVYKWLSFFAWHHYIIPFTYHMQRRRTMAVGGPPRATLSFFFFEVCNTPIPLSFLWRVSNIYDVGVEIGKKLRVRPRVAQVLITPLFTCIQRHWVHCRLLHVQLSLLTNVSSMPNGFTWAK